MTNNHELNQGDLCEVTNGRHKGKTVLILKAGIQTKYGLRAITVEHISDEETGEERLWVDPTDLAFLGEKDAETAKALNDADYQAYLARKNAGVPPRSSFNRKPFNRPRKDSNDLSGY